MISSRLDNVAANYNVSSDDDVSGIDDYDTVIGNEDDMALISFSWRESEGIQSTNCCSFAIASSKLQLLNKFCRNLLDEIAGELDLRLEITAKSPRLSNSIRLGFCLRAGAGRALNIG